MFLFLFRQRKKFVLKLGEAGIGIVCRCLSLGRLQSLLLHRLPFNTIIRLSHRGRG